MCLRFVALHFGICFFFFLLCSPCVFARPSCSTSNRGGNFYVCGIALCTNVKTRRANSCCRPSDRTHHLSALHQHIPTAAGISQWHIAGAAVRDNYLPSLSSSLAACAASAALIYDPSACRQQVTSLPSSALLSLPSWPLSVSISYSLQPSVRYRLEVCNGSFLVTSSLDHDIHTTKVVVEVTLPQGYLAHYDSVHTHTHV